MCVLCLCAAPDSVVFSSLNFERSSIVLHKLFRNVDLLAQAQAQVQVQVQTQGAEDARGEPQSADGGADAANLTSAAVEVAAAPTTATAVGKFSATVRRRWQSAVALLQGQRGRGQGSTGGASASDQSRIGSGGSIISSSNSNSSSSFNSSLSSPAAGAGRPAWSPALNATLLGLLSPMNVSKSELLFLPATQGEGIIKTWGSLHLPVTDRNNEVGCRRRLLRCDVNVSWPAESRSGAGAVRRRQQGAGGVPSARAAVVVAGLRHQGQNQLRRDSAHQGWSARSPSSHASHSYYVLS